MVFTALFNKKCRSDEKCQKLCNGNGQPDAGDAEENRKDKYHGKLEHQGSQKGDHGRDQSVVQRVISKSSGSYPTKICAIGDAINCAAAVRTTPQMLTSVRLFLNRFFSSSWLAAP